MPMQVRNDEHGQLTCPGIAFPFAKLHHEPIKARIKSFQKLGDLEDYSDNAEKDIYEIAFEHDEIVSWDYQPGDTVGILPRNSEEEVEVILEAIGLSSKADNAVFINRSCPKPKKSTSSLLHVPAVFTPRILLKDCLNIRSVPKKQFLRALAGCCTDEVDINVLNSLSSKEGSSEYNDLFLQKGVGLCGVLRMCRSCKPSLGLLIEHLPRLLPRPYSIVNSPLRENHENTIEIIFSILKNRPGVATNFLRDTVTKRVDKSVYLYPRTTNSFRFTSSNLERNQILICVGTGIAPFLGFLEFKENLINNRPNSSMNVGETWLFVGAKTTATVIRRGTLLKWRGSGVLNRYFESLSCDPSSAKGYVQDQIEANATELIKLLLVPETSLYVCADGSQISKCIETSIRNCLIQELKVSSDEANAMLKNLRKDGKYIEDLWT